MCSASVLLHTVKKDDTRERLGSYGTSMEPVSSNLEVVTPSWRVVRSRLLTEG